MKHAIRCEQIRVILKSLEDGWNFGFDACLEEIFYKELTVGSSYIGAYFESQMEIFGTSSLHSSSQTFKSNFGFKSGYAHGICCHDIWDRLMQG